MQKKNLLISYVLFFYLIFCITIVSAQTPSESLFKGFLYSPSDAAYHQVKLVDSSITQYILSLETALDSNFKIFVKVGAPVSVQNYDYSSNREGKKEIISIPNPELGIYYIMICVNPDLNPVIRDSRGVGPYTLTSQYIYGGRSISTPKSLKLTTSQKIERTVTTPIFQVTKKGTTSKPSIMVTTKVTLVDPNNAVNWYNKGKELGKLGKYQEALDAFNKALEIDPNNPNAWYNKGVSLNYLGRDQEALDAYNKALSINSNSAIVWFNKAITLKKLGKYQEALDASNKALEIDPNIK